MTSPTNRFAGNYRNYRREAQIERAAYLRDLRTSAVSKLPTLPGAKRGLGLFGAGLTVATAAFWAVMLTSPPQTAASDAQASNDVQSTSFVTEQTAQGTGQKAMGAEMALDGYEDR